MAEFAPGKLSKEAYRKRMAECTSEQLGLLMNDPAFHAWQAQKAARENRARAASNVLAVAGCVLLLVTLALLKPAANATPGSQAQAPMAPASVAIAGPPAADASYTTALAEDSAPVQPSAALLEADEVYRVLDTVTHNLEFAHQENEAAWDTISDLSLQLRRAEQEKAEAEARMSRLEAEQEVLLAAEEEKQRQTARLVAQLTARLREMKQEVEEAEQAAAAAEEAAAAAEEAAAIAEEQAAAMAAASAAQTPAAAVPDPSTCEAPIISSAYSALLVGLPVPFANATYVMPSPSQLSEDAVHAPATNSIVPLYTFLAAVACTALALLIYVRDRRAIAAEAARALQLSARLKEASFAKDTAEQSLALLEAELQHRMKQLEEVQQKAATAAAASPVIGTPPPPNHTPAKGELPPPPAILVEKFLRDHNFLAVQQDQMEEWLEMEQQFAEMQGALAELQSSLAEKDAQIAVYEQDFNSINEHSSLELRTREDQLGQVRTWLDEAQEELLNTQAALQEREAECRRVTSQLEALQAAAAINAQATPSSKESHEAELARQNQELVQQLQEVTRAYEEMQAKLTASSSSDALLAFNPIYERPSSAASTVPGTPMDLTNEVQSCLEMMRATRAQLADRLAHSQAHIAGMIADCQVANQGSQAEDDVEVLAEEESSPAGFGSAIGSPAASERSEQQHEQQGEEVEVEEVMVLGESKRHHINVQPSLQQQQTPSPVKKKQKGKPAGGQRSRSPSPNAKRGSMRKAWQEAHAHVAHVREQHNNWDVLGFVRQLGFEVEEAAAPVDRSEFLAMKERAAAVLEYVASTADAPHERALAGEAMQVLHDWEWPVQRINTPPPSPFWRLLGLQS